MKKIGFFIICTVFICSSCSNFEEININPNNPSTVPPEMLLSPIISGAVRSMTGSGSRAGQYVQHLAWLGGTSEGDGRYNLTGASFREEWNVPMRLIKDVNRMKIIAKNNRQQEYEAVAIICKVYILSLMTDAYGDIPYAEAGMGDVSGMEFSHYQSQSEVYSLMLEDLETANDLLAALPVKTVINRDILYKGNPNAWRRFANSLKIRILMRQSQKKDVSADVAKIFSDPAKYPVFETNSDQATLEYNNNPDYYEWFMQNPPADGSGVNFESNERVSDVMVNMLLKFNDPRLYIYAAPTGNSYRKHVSNSLHTLEYRGQTAGLSAMEQDEVYKNTGLNKDDYSVIGKRIRKENRAFLMTCCELLLLKTEAIHRKMIQGNAGETYKAAVRASFDKWQRVGQDSDETTPFISEEQKTAYFRPETAYNPDKGLQQIAEQQWIDSFLNGFEGWASWRRTGYPSIKPGPSVLSPIPVRYVYSDNEQNNPNLVKWVKETTGGTMPDHNVKVWFQP
ncbi:MAG: SusD/RagB family nutrient-binding outer membrane lipoprotein [Dysgonamonadaceae bacterium]|jgi:hypothetical protein|nr:SusD/RagB family nutrient-binding outer membrane lipoprotein [Dysgonamonadaceae bacterium]